MKNISNYLFFKIILNFSNTTFSSE